MQFIGSIAAMKVHEDAEAGKTYTITARVFPARTGLKFQAVQGTPEVTLDEQTVPLCFAWQDVALEVLSASADDIVIRTDQSLMLVDNLEVVEKNLPGLEIINFRHLPESVKPSITAASFGTPANVSIDAGGIKLLGAVNLPLSGAHDHIMIMASFSGPSGEGDDQPKIGAGALAIASPCLFANYTGGEMYVSGEGAVALYTDIIPNGDPVMVTGAMDSADVHFDVTLGSTHLMRIASLLIMAWDDPVA